MNYFQSQIFSSFSKGLQKKFDIYAIEFARVGVIYLLSRILDVRQSKIYSRYYYENEKSSINNCLNVRNVATIYLNYFSQFEESFIRHPGGPHIRIRGRL